ncbi:MAG: fatty acid-binding protein DegV [Marinilabiliales bacterium]|nr:MAG: fatty acid-binding protein DegV [Marinilabiliales bacterium]
MMSKLQQLNTLSIKEINGKQLYHSFLSGAHRIFENQSILNKINVFPVADADTGTNLASTMRSIIDIAIPDENLKISAVSIADAALTGARGNSGIIFAQFLYGFSNELKAKETITVEDFAESMRNAVKYAYEAIANPVEGTILSVIKDWAEHLYDLKDRLDDFILMLIEAFLKATESLNATSARMKELTKTEVVDAGAKGFVVFLEGMLEFFKTGKQVSAEALNADQVVEEDVIVGHDVITYRYCSEALLTGENLNKEDIKKALDGFGDSMVVAGSPQKTRIHIHTDTPWLLFVELGKLGNIASQKVDDMVMQHAIASSPKEKIALATDSSCDLPAEIIEKYQIQVVPLSIHFGETFYLDGITMKPEQFNKMLDTSPVYPSTSQPAYKEFYNRYNYLSTHFESIIAVNISRQLSGTWQNSLNAATKVGEHTGKRIDVVNSKLTSVALGLLLVRAAKSLEEGMTHDEVLKGLQDWIDKSKVLVTASTLKYMVKSGRVSNTKGFIGKLMNLKPVITVNKEGKTEAFGKAFTIKQSMKLVMKDIEKFIEGKKVWGYAIGHASNEKTALWYAEKMEALTGKKPEYIHNASPALVANVGIGVVDVAVLLD